MYCSACGTALSNPVKYCRSCGTQLVPKKDAGEISALEQRFDDYLTDLFWVTVWGLGLILGGAALLQKLLHLGAGLIAAYAILSSSAFTIIFSLCLWKTLCLAREARKAKEIGAPQPLDTNELDPAPPPIVFGSSVIENTTRRMEPAKEEPATSGGLRL